MRLTILIALVSLVSCLKTEVLNEIPVSVDTTMYKAKKPMPEHQPDTTQTEERVPIGWDVSVEDWGD